MLYAAKWHTGTLRIIYAYWDLKAYCVGGSKCCTLPLNQIKACAKHRAEGLFILPRMWLGQYEYHPGRVSASLFWFGQSIICPLLWNSLTILTRGVARIGLSGLEPPPPFVFQSGLGWAHCLFVDVICSYQCLAWQNCLKNLRISFNTYYLSSYQHSRLALRLSSQRLLRKVRKVKWWAWLTVQYGKHTWVVASYI